MKDRFDRVIDYIRVSVTDLCNLRCVYCIAPEGVERLTHDEILSFEEIVRVLRAASGEGIHKVRLTGGEPLVRRGIIDLVRMVTQIDRIDEVVLTTNGLLLGEMAADLKKAGLDRVNISLDSLIGETFKTITRGGDLAEAMAGIDAAGAASLKPIKINMVPLRGMNEEEVVDFARLSIEREWNVRFIEYMPTEATGGDRSLFVGADEVRERICELFGDLEPVEPVQGNGPAREFRIAGAKGTVAFISAMSNSFCKWCNRLRLTSEGRLRACLLDGGEVDVRNVLRSGGTDDDLRKALRECAALKPLEHGNAASVRMREIGG